MQCKSKFIVRAKIDLKESKGSKKEQEKPGEHHIVYSECRLNIQNLKTIAMTMTTTTVTYSQFKIY